MTGRVGAEEQGVTLEHRGQEMDTWGPEDGEVEGVGGVGGVEGVGRVGGMANL